MTRNQWIGVGCGGAGCLGLLVLVVVGVAFFYLSFGPQPEPNANSSHNSNRSSDQNSNTTSPTPGSSSSLSEETRHRLFQAASTTYDKDLIQRVNRKLGLLGANDVPNERYAEFLKDHLKWIFGNTEWLRSIDTPEKARAYVNEHIDD
jgi:ABC-type microcin C transport system permease subunit YejB